MSGEVECDHQGSKCPAHSHLWIKGGAGEPGGLVHVLTCLYGGLETKDGTPFDETDAAEVMSRVADRIGRMLDG